MSWFDDWFIFCVFYDSLMRKSSILFRSLNELLSQLVKPLRLTLNFHPNETSNFHHKSDEQTYLPLRDVVILFMNAYFFSTKNLQTSESKFMILHRRVRSLLELLSIIYKINRNSNSINASRWYKRNCHLHCDFIDFNDVLDFRHRPNCLHNHHHVLTAHSVVL